MTNYFKHLRTLVFLLIWLMPMVAMAFDMTAEGFWEAQFGRNWHADKKRFNIWDPNLYLETRLKANPAPGTEMFVKFFADKDNDNWRNQGKLEAVISEMWAKYRYEQNNSGFEVKFFSRGGSPYWLDGTMLGIVSTGQVNDGDNGQGARLDLWHNLDGSATYVFSDFSSNSAGGDDIHMFRLRQNFLDKRVRSGLFYLRKNYGQGFKDDYNEVYAGDLHLKIGDRYYLNAEAAASRTPSEDWVNQTNDTYYHGNLDDILKANLAAKMEFTGFRVGHQKTGYWFLNPGVYSFGNTYRNYMGDNNSNKYGAWVNSYWLVPGRAITLTVNYNYEQKYEPTLVDVYGPGGNYTKRYWDPESNFYTELYLEFIKGFKGKIYYNQNQSEVLGKTWHHNDLFFEMSVENKLAKLLTQFKIKDMGETNEKQIAGIETRVNLTDRWTFFARGMIVNDRVGSRRSMFGELQYRVFGNTELYLQYGPSWYGQYGLVSDDSFASGGDMAQEVKLILKGWF